MSPGKSIFNFKGVDLYTESSQACIERTHPLGAEMDIFFNTFNSFIVSVQL